MAIKWRVNKWLDKLKPKEDQVPGPAPIPDVPVPGSWTDVLPTINTSVMEVTEAEENETSSPSPKSSTVASTIGPSGLDNTASVTSLSSVVEMSNEDLESLVMQITPSHLARLKELAEGSGQPVGEIVRQIAIYLLEEESEFEELGLADAVSYYVENQIL